MSDDLEPIQDDDAQIQAMVEQLYEQFPTIESKGFDLTQVRGNLTARSCKALILHLKLSGWSIAEMADALGFCTRTVGNLLVDAIQEAVPIDDVDILRSLELQRLDRIERMAIEQFYKSCKVKTTKFIKSGDDIDEATALKLEEMGGNPGYLRVLLEVSKRRSALLGMDAPKKSEVTKDSRTVKVVHHVVNTREEVQQAKNAGLLKSE